MRKARWLQTVVFTTALTYGQTMIDLRTQSKSVDFSGAISTTPFKSGTALPSTCTVGEMFYLTSAAPGANLYGCPSLNSWSLESGGSTLPAVSGNSGKVMTTDGTNFLWTAPGGDISGQIGSATVTGRLRNTHQRPDPHLDRFVLVRTECTGRERRLRRDHGQPTGRFFSHPD
jgi:hypothetical protein